MNHTFISECGVWNLPQTNAKTEFTSPRKNSRRFCWFALQNLWQKIFNDRWKESTRKNSHCRQTIRVFVLRKGVCPKSKHAGKGLFSYFLLWFDLNDICCLSSNVTSKAAFYLHAVSFVLVIVIRSIEQLCIMWHIILTISI